VQDIIGDKALKDDLSVMAVRSNYCNVLFNLYRYEEAIALLKKLVVILEGLVYPTIAELKKKSGSLAQKGPATFKQQVHQLVCNYYLLGSLPFTKETLYIWQVRRSRAKLSSLRRQTSCEEQKN
jgi:hypothetical protein